MKKIRYVVLLSLLLPACQIAVPSDPSGNSIPSASVSASSQINISVTPSPQDSSNLNTNNTGSPSSAPPLPTPIPTEGSPSDNDSQPTISPTPSHHGNMPGPGDARCVSLVPLTQEEIDRGCVYLPPKPHPTSIYSNNKPVPEGIMEGNVHITFKDEYKVRYDKEKKEFFSLTGADVTNINNIITAHSFEYVNGRFDITEEQAEEREKRLEKSSGYDYHNVKSSYTFAGIKNTDIKTLIEKIRLDPLVRQANYDPGTTNPG